MKKPIETLFDPSFQQEVRQIPKTIPTKNDTKVYSVQDIQDILGLGRTTAYEFIRNVYKEKKLFKVLKIGDTYKIPKKSFDEWLDS